LQYAVLELPKSKSTVYAVSVCIKCVQSLWRLMWDFLSGGWDTPSCVWRARIFYYYSSGWAGKEDIYTSKISSTVLERVRITL